MAELLPSEVPLKKRKIEAQSPDQENSCRQVPVRLLSSTELLLQIPPNTNTSLPVWECVNATQAGVQWSETPYSITIQITPLTTQKARSNDQPVNQPQPPCQFKHVPLPVCLLPTLSGLDHNGDTDCPSVFFKLAAKTFYTKPSKYIHICDDFLTGCCPHKLSCERHHTPLPFHWQLRHWNTQQWVNISLSAQVKLEKLYCDPDQETIRLQDIFPVRTEAFTLHLETKKVTSAKYDKARRLSSSRDPEMSPHFPTEWSIYWWNDGKWEKYEKEVSKELVGAIEAGETSRGFYIGKQLYEVDFSRMIQMNLTTKFERRIRRRPTFRSPFSIKSNLKTVSLGEPPRPFGQVLPRLSVDPLQEFSSWYPPVWNLSPNQGFSLVEVPPSAKAYQSIHCLFHSTMLETKTEIISIQQVQNIFHWDRYRRQKEHMQIHSTAHSWSLEQHLFHGTTEDCAKEICLNNFDPRVSGKNGVVYGRGSYFARDARYSLKYAAKSGGGNQHMFLAKVLVGNVTLGNATYSRPPRLNPLTPGYELYDTCVDKISDPSIFVVFDNCQCYPYYLIKYKAVSDLVNICE
ncbi:protein mono-ADP-ribosyltransferase TIPARP-like [Anguilla rostrata]|uniref:protein mono-ADP-ribosyltransferase TIPARP-like n=1 Tax=Anguilla rostrata TaxID=7938 RepID=UPI0030D4E424